jgi:hypothetical protein
VTSCQEIRLELGAYVLEGLEPDERNRVDQHVASCLPCRAELEELGEVTALLGKREPLARHAPPDLKQRVLARPPRGRHRAPLLVAGLAVIAALLGVAGANVLDRPPPADAVLSLRGTAPVAISGEAELRQLDTGVRVDLDLAGLRTADEGYYHAWLHRGDRRASAGTFTGTAESTAQVQLLCGGDLGDYDRMTITWHGFDEPEEVVALEARVTG